MVDEGVLDRRKGQRATHALVPNVLSRNRATGHPDIQTTRVMMRFGFRRVAESRLWCATFSAPPRRAPWIPGARRLVYLEYSLHSSVMTAFDLSLALSEARDLLILSVTRGLLQRSEKVAPHRMIRAISQAVRGCVKLPVMPRAVGCVAQPIIVMPRGVGCVRVTRSMMSRHVRQNITSVAMPVVRTAAAVPIAPIAPIAATVADGPVTSATTVATAPATVADGPVTTAATPPRTVATAPATVADGPVTTTAALSRSRNRSNRARDTHAEDRHRCVPFNVPHAFISCGNDSAFALSGWSTYKRV